MATAEEFFAMPTPDEVVLLEGERAVENGTRIG